MRDHIHKCVQSFKINMRQTSLHQSIYILIIQCHTKSKPNIHAARFVDSSSSFTLLIVSRGTLGQEEEH